MSTFTQKKNEMMIKKIDSGDERLESAEEEEKSPNKRIQRCIFIVQYPTTFLLFVFLIPFFIFCVECSYALLRIDTHFLVAQIPLLYTKYSLGSYICQASHH